MALITGSLAVRMAHISPTMSLHSLLKARNILPHNTYPCNDIDVICDLNEVDQLNDPSSYSIEPNKSANGFVLVPKNKKYKRIDVALTTVESNKKLIGICDKYNLYSGISMNINECSCKTLNAYMLYLLYNTHKHKTFHKFDAVSSIISSLRHAAIIYAEKNRGGVIPFKIRYTREEYKAMELDSYIDDRIFINQDIKDWYFSRCEETYTKKPNLNVSKSEFFNDNVDYVWDHDSIHEAVKNGRTPAYKRFMLDGSEVMCDKNKFTFDISYYDKAQSVIEEACVLAVERIFASKENESAPKTDTSIEINGKKLNTHDAFVIALRKTCTTLASGWWRNWAYCNYSNILGHALDTGQSHGYYRLFRDGVKNGVVKPYQKG